ncbi:hypothetical protein BDQ12DRAFT_692922 [Crucibulum laeve]|uniref:DUF6533 domain-containing protein n=1 Tax=Crucibulum laeve TaxID=68775 RepID=A0A5C3LIY8_9AGAR|nr:hypothetical protein BDQ12DRAFT_692922 [Crucibulum laeve]
MSLGIEIVNTEVYKSVHIRNASCLAALIVLLYEYSITFAQEYQFVWKSRRTKVKWIYLFSQYFALSAQIANIILLALHLSKIPVRRELCRPWFLFLIISACMLLAALEIVLMFRGMNYFNFYCNIRQVLSLLLTAVCALYRRSSRVKIFFIVIFIINQVIVADYVRRESSLPLGDTCEITELPYEVIYPIFTVMLTQSIIWIMTVTRRNIAYGRAPIVGLMIRDGAWIFVLLCAMYSINIPYALTKKASTSHITRGQ